MWNKIKAWFIQDDPTNLVLPESEFKPYRKKQDSTPLTQGMYDFVIKAKSEQEDFNNYYDGSNGEEKKYQTTEELTAFVNMVFGTNFSRSKLTRIWTGKIDRKDLPEGKTYNPEF